MPLPEATADHYRHLQRIQLTTLAAAAAAWSRMGPDFDATWPAAGAQLLALVTAAQGAAARSGAAYVPAALTQQGADLPPDAAVDPGALAGVASDGRDLDTLLYGAVTTAKSAVGGGAAPALALAEGGRWLGMAVRTQVTDAAREAASVAITVRPRAGWTRMVNPPCCPRCAILAGKWFRWNTGFKRHPNCDCVHIPCTEDAHGDVRTDPRGLFEDGQVRGLSSADARAIADGADPGQVVNASRGMSTAQVSGRQLQTTTEGTTRRGLAYRALRDQRVNNGGADTRATTDRYRRIRAPRLMPSSIYEIAADREDALRLLRLHGYLL